MDGITVKRQPGGVDHRFRLPDGRAIGYRSYGAASGPAVLALHGTPGSRLKFSAADMPAKALGMRVIAPDRWGYGMSDVHPKPSLGAYCEDMRAFADGLGIDRFALMGVSGGGPYAAAAAALLGARVTALALVSPVGPISGEAAASEAGAGEPGAGEPGACEAVVCKMSAFHKFCFLTLPHRPAVVRLIFRAFRYHLRKAPGNAMALAMSRAAKADREVMKVKAVRERLSATFIEGLAPGFEGPVIDLRLFGAAWEMPLADIVAPAQMWLGAEDRNVPLAAAHCLAAKVPRCKTNLMQGEGHLWVAQHYDEVLGWLAEAMSAGVVGGGV